MFQHRRRHGISLRLIPPEVAGASTSWGCPRRRASCSRPGPGLVLVAGRAGRRQDHHAGRAGRRPDQRAALPRRDHRRSGRVSCCKDRRGVVVQREVGLRRPVDRAGAARVGAGRTSTCCWSASSRDRETAELALAAAETGRLVLRRRDRAARAPTARRRTRPGRRCWDAEGARRPRAAPNRGGRRCAACCTSASCRGPSGKGPHRSRPSCPAASRRAPPSLRASAGAATRSTVLRTRPRV